MENLDRRDALFSLAQQKNLYGSLGGYGQGVESLANEDLVAIVGDDEGHRVGQEERSDVLNYSYGI
jgi:hypothetical protein